MAETERGPAAPQSATQRASVTALVIAEVNRRDIPHRKGWKPSDWPEPSLEHLRSETDELDEALREFNKRAQMVSRFSGWDADHDAALRHAREECADVFACVLQTAYRLGMTFDALDTEAERKVRLRFIGAHAIDVTRERTADSRSESITPSLPNTHPQERA